MENFPSRRIFCNLPNCRFVSFLRMQNLSYRFCLSGLLGTLLLASIFPVNSQASEWPQFRGEHSNGKSADLQVPVHWSSRKNLKWKTLLPGPGSSSPIVTRNQVLVTCYSGYGVGDGDPGEMENLVRHLVCVDRSDGSVRWERKISARLPEDPYRGYISEHGYASNTPVTNGREVFVFFGKTGVIAFDLNGRELWRADVGQESSNRQWGSAASLTLHGENVIVNASEESQSIRALNQQTGEQVWIAEASSLELAYGTPLLAAAETGKTSLLIAVPGEVWGLDPSTGKLDWYATTDLPGNICPSLSVADGVVYGFGGFPTRGSFAVRLGGKGDVTASHLVWTSRASSYVASPVFHEGYLYWISDRGDAICMKAGDGSVQFQERLPSLEQAGRRRAVYASVIYAADKLYAVSRYSGTYVLAAKPSFSLIAQNRLEGDDSQFNGTPAFADNGIYIRSDRYLYCISAK